MPVYTDEELDAERQKNLTSRVRKGYGVFNGYTMPIHFGEIREEIENMEVYDDDIWVCTFPKCGTTWSQEMIWCICNNLDYEAAKQDLDLRFPFLEVSCVFYSREEVFKEDLILKSVEFAKNLQRPRFIKTHLPWELLPKQIRNFERRPKIVHVARNPMDTCVSFFYHSKFLEHYMGDFDLFVQLFLKNKVNWSPYDQNILGYWRRRNEPNVLFLKFEDMKSNLGKVVDAVAEFFKVSLPADSKETLLKHLSFDSMKNNKSTTHSIYVDFLKKNNLIWDQEGKFMRSGKSGGYRSEMSQEMINVFKKQFLDVMEKEGLKFTV